jgi:hypothetical protein
MNDLRKTLADVTGRLIGEGKRFRSARELAQRAHTLGYVENVDSFARNVSRVLKGDHDTQMSTVDAISRAAGLQLSDFLKGEAPPPENVKSMINEPDGTQTVESINARRTTLLAESLTRASSELLGVIEHLIEIDAAGGKARSLVLQDVQTTLQLFPLKDSGSGKQGTADI